MLEAAIPDAESVFTPAHVWGRRSFYPLLPELPLVPIEREAIGILVAFPSVSEYQQY